jgi:hypothetical protein
MAHGAAAHAAMIAAIKASGAIVRVDPDSFQRLLTNNENAAVVHATGWAFGSEHRYLVSYKGLVFFTKSRSPLFVPPSIETIEAKRIWVPG